MTTPPTEASTDIASLVLCEDLPEVTTEIQGSLSQFANPDEAVLEILSTYTAEHPETYAGRWIDRDAGGTLVLAFTDDPARHLDAVLARVGQRDDVAIDVVQLEFTEAELMAANDDFWRDRPEYVLSGGIDIRRNRIWVDLIDPTPEEIDDLATRLPLDRGCVTVTTSPVPPSGPLDILPADPADTLLTCWFGGGPSFPASALDERAPVEASDHPAAQVLVDTVAAPPPTLALEDIEQPPPTDSWFVLSIDDATATFGNGTTSPLTVAVVENDGGAWTFGWWSISCASSVALPEGLGSVRVALDPDEPPPAPADRAIHVLVSEQACASGQPMGERLRGPQIQETDTEILIAFAVESTVGPATCPGNPSEPMTIELADPIGDRSIRNGLLYPPAALERSR